MDKRWGVLLDGHKFDLLDWHEGLNSAFDPVVEKRIIREQEEFVLFSSGFDPALDSQTIRDDADVIVAGMNGAMAILRRAGQVTVKGVADFADGDPKIHVFARGVGFVGRSRLSAAGVVLRADGTRVPPPPPQRSATQNWLELSRQSDDAADLLTYASRADNWFDVYKMIEAASVLAGGESKLVKLCGEVVKVAKRRANEARHHRVKVKGDPLSFDDTRAIAFRAADIVLTRVASGP